MISKIVKLLQPCIKRFPAFESSTSFVHSSANRLQENLSKVLASIVGNEFISESQSVREQHSHDESYHRSILPRIVVWPNSVSEVCEVAKACSAHKICMIPFGTGTGLEGGVAPLVDAVSVDLTKMDNITNLNVEDFDVQVRPGVTRKRLNHELRDTGLWFPVDPGADASLCGMAATGASGTNAVRYGTMKQNVLNLEVVLADGTLLHTAGGRHCKKSSAGYNLTELFVGSEGTLGFITSATLRLHGVPETSKSAVCGFSTILNATDTAVQIMQCNIPIARIELLDATSMKAINAYGDGMNYAVKPTLFLEFHGSEASTQEQIDLVSEISNQNSGSDFVWASSQEEVNHLWYARHNVMYALQGLKPGSCYYSTDVCVPVTALPEAIAHSVEVLDDHGITNGIVGHVGDGNYHCVLMVSDNEKSLVKKVGELIGRKAIELGGSCTGEHGVGLGKKDLLIEEVGKNSVQVMHAIKKAIDPNNLMNPGKVLNY